MCAWVRTGRSSCSPPRSRWVREFTPGSPRWQRRNSTRTSILFAWSTRRMESGRTAMSTAIPPPAGCTSGLGDRIRSKDPSCATGRPVPRRGPAWSRQRRVPGRGPPGGAGVAVVGETVADAQRGLRALNVSWDDSGAERRSSSELMAEHVRLLESAEKAVVSRDEGDVDAALAAAQTTIDATYTLAHAAME